MWNQITNLYNVFFFSPERIKSITIVLQRGGRNNNYWFELNIFQDFIIHWTLTEQLSIKFSGNLNIALTSINYVPFKSYLSPRLGPNLIC